MRILGFSEAKHQQQFTSWIVRTYIFRVRVAVPYYVASPLDVVGLIVSGMSVYSALSVAHRIP